jgi:hypothetical protein
MWVQLKPMFWLGLWHAVWGFKREDLVNYINR